jgi:hypothetical protein
MLGVEPGRTSGSLAAALPGFRALHFVVAGFDGGDAAEAPGGDDGGAEDFLFGGSDGEIGLGPMVEELEEFGGVFAGRDGTHRGEAVFERVLADGGASFGVRGPVDFCALARLASS